MKKIQKQTLSLVTLLCLSPVRMLHAQSIWEQSNSPSEFAEHGLETLNKTISAVNVFLALLFIASIMGLVVSGVKFVIAGGDEGVLESARRTGIASLVGVFLSLIGYVIVNVIKHFVV